MASELQLATVNSTSYPKAPNITATNIAGGRWSVYNSDNTILVFVSLDGIRDYAVIKPGKSWIVQQEQHSGQLWLRLGTAGSVGVYAQEELGFDPLSGTLAMSVNATGFTVVVAAANTPYDLAPAVGNGWGAALTQNGCTVSQVNAAATVTARTSAALAVVAGGFFLYNASGVAVLTVKIQVAVNGVLQTTDNYARVTAGGVQYSVGPFLVTAATGDVIKLQITNATNTDDIGVDGQITMFPVGSV